MTHNMSETSANKKVTSLADKPSNETFVRCMIGISTRCLDLKEAIANHDFKSVGIFARSAVDMWVIGRAACRRLLAHAKCTSLYAESARQLLEQQYIALLEVFAVASEAIPVPSMVQTLQGLRTRLTSANAEALRTP